jgi:flavin-binding protein dodecin
MLSRPFINQEENMSVAKVTEIIATSPKSFDDAVKNGSERATRTLKKVQGAWITDQSVKVNKKGKICEYKVRMKITFVLKD